LTNLLFFSIHFWFIKKIEIPQSTNIYIIKQSNMAAKQLEMRVAELEKLVAGLNTKADALANPEKTTKSKSKKEKLSDDDTPKKPKAKTGYLVYSSEKREEIKTLLEEETGEKPKPKDVISKLGSTWKALSDEEKEAYNAKAKEMAAAVETD